MNPNLIAYVAGPYSAKDRTGVEDNIKRATVVGLELASMGVTPLIPHANTSHPVFERLQPYIFWIHSTAALLRRSDCIVLADFWEYSSGACGEVDIALLRGMPVYTSPGALVWRLQQQQRQARGPMSVDRELPEAA